MFPGIQNSLSAMRAYTRGVSVSARSVAKVPSRDPYEARDTVNLSTASESTEVAVRRSSSAGGPDVGMTMVDMVLSERAIQANAAVIRASDKTLGVLLDTVA